MEAKIRFYTNRLGGLLCVLATIALFVTALYLRKFHILFEGAFFSVLALIFFSNADEAKKEKEADERTLNTIKK